MLRLRQICLASPSLAPVQDLRSIFGVEVCHRSERVARHGLENALLPFGNTFLEVVAPIRAGTAVGRFLERSAGSGYIVVLNDDGMDATRRRAEGLNVRIINEPAYGEHRGVQFHPRDVGGAILEVNWTVGADDIEGPYGCAGPRWREFVRREVVSDLEGAELSSTDPRALGERWAVVLARPLECDGQDYAVALDKGLLRFRLPSEDRGEGLTGIDVAGDRELAVARARQAGYACGSSWIDIAGIRFNLVTSS